MKTSLTLPHGRKKLEACTQRAKPISPMKKREDTSEEVTIIKKCARKMSQRIIIQFYRAIKLAKDPFKKANGNGALGPPHPHYRRQGQDRNRAGPRPPMIVSIKSFACKTWRFPCKRRRVDQSRMAQVHKLHLCCALSPKTIIIARM